MIATATASPTTTTSPALISVNVIAQQIRTTPESVLDYCRTQGVFTASLYDGGEFMVDFNSINEEFVRGFALANMEPSIQESVTAIEAIRGNSETAVEIATQETTTQTESVESTASAPAKQRKWKMIQKGRVLAKGKTMRETVVNLFAMNDPSNKKGFIESLKNRDESADKIVKEVIRVLYEGARGTEVRLWKAIDSYIAELSEAVG